MSRPIRRRPIVLGDRQWEKLLAATQGKVRACPGNAVFRRLAEHGFVESEPNFSTRTGKPTIDRLFSATPSGRAYVAGGRR